MSSSQKAIYCCWWLYFICFCLTRTHVELNTTLTKTIKSTSELTILDAIEALKYQLTKQDIPNAGGWLNKAIKEGWTKPEVTVSKSTKPEQKIVTATDKLEKKLVDPNKLKKLSNIFNKKNDW